LLFCFSFYFILFYFSFIENFLFLSKQSHIAGYVLKSQSHRSQKILGASFPAARGTIVLRFAGLGSVTCAGCRAGYAGHN
jgi:hypothetical protein